MEYIIVKIKDQPNVDAVVLINGQTYGRTGVLLTLGGPGWILVSVYWPGAELEVRTNARPPDFCEVYITDKSFHGATTRILVKMR
jgi:hypothetical protein